MPRAPRINHENAFYHVMNRGRNRENIFHEDVDFELFLDLMNQSHLKFGAVFHCYCLMSNHYHFLIQTKDANLSDIMCFIGRKYVVNYNRRKDKDGALFKDRFKSILIDKDPYLLALNRYIHRNPRCITGNLRDYKWSSYPDYLNIKKKPNWLDISTTIDILGLKYSDVESYARFIEEEDYASGTGYDVPGGFRV